MTQQPRQSQGQPTGGQYAKKTTEEGEVTIDGQADGVSAAWTKFGFDQGGRAEWERAGFDPHAANDWRWALNATASVAREWDSEGFDPDSAVRWRSRFDAKEAGKWAGRGFRPGEAVDWDKENFTPETAERWKRSGAEAHEAQAWRDAGFGYATWRTWQRLTRSPKQAWELAEQYGHSVNEAIAAGEGSRARAA